MTADLPSVLSQVLEGQRRNLLDFSQDLIRIATENPPGSRYAECARRICSELDRLGFEHRVVESPGADGRIGHNVLSFHGTESPTLYFHGHYDVVPAQRRDQFDAHVKRSRLYGRGSADMKAGLGAMIYATHALKELNLPSRGRIGLCIVADEETGGQVGSRHLDELGLLGRDAIGMLTPEPTSGAVWNANRGAVTLRITVSGKAAHVGLQHLGINAFEQMLQVAGALQHLKAEVERRTTGYRIVPDGAARSILMLGGRVEGGSNFNVVPATCSFTVERRFNPEEDLATEKARLLDVLDGERTRGIDLEVEVLQEGDSSGVPDDHPMARTLAAVVREVTGEEPAFGLCPGLLETRWYARKGIPALAYGPGFLELAHGPDESVRVDDVLRYALIYALAGVRLLDAG